MLQHSTYKVIASAGSPSDVQDIRVSPDHRALVILTIDDVLGSSAEAAENIRTLRARLACPIIVVVAETRDPVDIPLITALAPNAFIANLTSRELLLKVLDLATLAQPVLVLSAAAEAAPAAEPLALPEPIHGLGGYGAGSIVPADAHCNGEGPLFSQRERQILSQLARGNSNKEIARQFNITESTVKVHLKALLRKIGVRNRTQAALWAVANGCQNLPADDHHLLQANKATAREGTSAAVRSQDEPAASSWTRSRHAQIGK